MKTAKVNLLKNIQLPESHIYKTHILDETGSVSTTIVFSRGTTAKASASSPSSSPLPSQTQTFTCENESYPVNTRTTTRLLTSSLRGSCAIVSEQQIHLDDSIRTIKQKILSEINRQKTQFTKRAYEEIYLFGKSANTGDIMRIGARIPSAANKYSAHEPEEESGRADADVAIRETNKDTLHINPYTLKLDALLPKPPIQYVYENSLLLNYEPVRDNEIMVCFAESVLEFVQQQMQADEATQRKNAEYIVQTYFPLLYDQRIYSLSDLQSQKRNLLKQTTEMVNDAEIAHNGIQLFYDIFYSVKEPIEYIQKGIREIRFSMTPEIAQINHLPLELIFKRIHSSRAIPFIKYNPGNRRENLYRLFYDKITRDGRKIPLLTKKQILKLAREMGKSDQIAIYVNPIERDTPLFYIHFEHTGEITIHGTHGSPLNVAQWNNIIKTQLNPIFMELNREFQQSGYKIPTFESLQNPNIRIFQLKYTASTAIKKDVRISEISCIYHILSVNRRSAAGRSNDPDIRYKRVENYTEMDAETALIAEIYNEAKHTGISGAEIIEILAERFGKTEEYARNRLIEFFKTDAEMMRTIADHPGFPMKIQIANFQPILEFEIEQIDSIRYLEPLETYIESIIHLSQHIAKTSDLGEYVRSVCAKSKKAEAAKTNAPQISNIISTGIPRETILDKPAAREIQPFMFADDEEDESFFAELGITKAESEARPDETYDMSETPLTPEEEMTTKQMDALFEELYKNTGADKYRDDSPIQEQEPEPSIELEKAPEKNPESVAKQPAAKTEPEAKPEAPKKEIPPAPIAPPVKTTPTPESDDDETPTGAIFYDNDNESDDEQQGGLPKKRDKRSVVDANTLLNPAATTGEANKTIGEMYDGKSLSNPFLAKMQQNEPNLFLAKSQGKFKTYSTACQPTSRHPVMLTDEEKQRIDREFPGSYKHAIKYGTDPAKPFWYICPRYWCFLTNSSISEEDVKAKKCGEIIPDDATEIPPGAYVYEFKGEESAEKPGDFNQYPGFLKEGKHPNGYCLPCCFKNWDKGLQKDRRLQCDMNKTDESDDPDARGRKRKPKNAADANQPQQQQQSEIYIISLDTYPLPKTRWGFLPIPVQLFLNLDYRSVISPNNSAMIRDNAPTLLRYGVEQVPKQSFLGVFADIYSRIHNMPASPSMEEFRKILAKEITLDVFVKAHNSSLISSFSPISAFTGEDSSSQVNTRTTTSAKQPITEATNAEIQEYKQSEFGKRLNMANRQEKSFFENTIASYRNFIAYITNPKETIDHTYLWDIFTSDIAGLNKGGVNLVLLEIAENDITDKIQYICPTNRYSKNIHDITKPSVIVLTHDEYYEPIYKFEFKKENNKALGISTRSIFRHNEVNNSIKRLLATIDHTSHRYCAPLPSLPKVYRFKSPIPLHALIATIRKDEYKDTITPIAQIVNYRNKVIGVSVRVSVSSSESGDQSASATTEIMLPCFPSAPSDEFGAEVKLRHMNEESIWTDYEKTRDALTHIYKMTNRAIPCLPRVKVMEDELVVGILTETNQFVQIMPPLKDEIDDGIPVERMTNMNAVDNEVATNPKADAKREKAMRQIRLENQFYAAFRGTIRELLGDYTNHTMRKTITDIIESPTQFYKTKLTRISELLRTLVSDRIIFVDMDDDLLRDMDEVNRCEEDNSPAGGPAKQPYCVVKENHVPQLSIPSANLLTKTISNEDLYYNRMADELLRYPRVRLFMFEPEKYFNLMDVNYQIRPGEMVVSQTTIQGDMLDDLEPLSDSSYVRNTNYDTARPAIQQTYSNDMITIENQNTHAVSSEFDAECVHGEVNIIGNPEKSMWKRSFPKTAKEVVFKNTAECSFYILMVILKAYTGEPHTILQVKQKIWEGYSRLFRKDSMHMMRCMEILKAQGKRKLMEPVIQKRMPFDARIFSEEYYISDLDIWVLADAFQLPIILFNPDFLKGFSVIHRIPWILCGGNTREKYFFIRSNLVDKDAKSNGIAKYNLVKPTFALNETRDFHAVVLKALRGEPAYKYNVWKIDEMLNEKQLLKK